MKRLLGIIILLILCNLGTYAQSPDITKAKVIRVNDGDSTFIFKQFEIDIKKKKIWTIEPNMSYLHIEGGKPKYKHKIKREKWNEVDKLLSEVNLSEYEEVAFDRKSYSIILYFEDNIDITFSTQSERELIKLKEIIKIIRE